MNWSIFINEPEVVDALIEELELKPCKRSHNNISVVIANLKKNGGVVRTSIDRNKPIPSDYNPLGLYKGGLVKTQKALEKHGYITITLGFNYGGNIRMMTKIEATEKMEGLLEHIAKVSQHQNTEIILVVCKEKGLTNYEDNELTTFSRDILSEYNKFLELHQLWHDKYPQLNVCQNGMVRRFRDHNKGLGGRVFASFQNIKSADRKDLLINGEKTTELDFKAVFPSMLFAGKGLNVFDEIGDPYDVETKVHADKIVNRKIIKTLVLTMLATKRIDYAVKAAMNSLSKEDFDVTVLDYQTMKKAVLELEVKYHQVAEAFYGGKEFPLRLQFWESNICMGVMDELARQDILCLPIHDSFIVQEKHREKLQESMINYFKEYMNGIEPVISKKF